MAFKFNPITGQFDLVNPAADISGKLDLAGGTMTGQLVLTAAADGALKLTPTWNNGAVSFAMIFGRVTNTASGADSKLIDLGTVAGGSLFSVSLAGGVVAAGVKARDSYLGYFQSAGLTLASDAAAITMGAFNDVTLDRPTADTLYLYSAYGSGSKLRIGGDNATRAKYLQLTHDGTNAVISSSSGSVVFDTATSSGAINISPTWNNAGTNFTGIYGRITNTASGASSKLIDVALADGSSGFVVTKAGNIQLTGTNAYRQPIIDVPGAAYGALALSLNGSVKFSVTAGSVTSNGVPIGSDWGGYLVLRDSGSSVTELSIKRGAGSPEGVVTSNPGSIYLNSSGGPPYYKNTGTGNTGWVLMS